MVLFGILHKKTQYILEVSILDLRVQICFLKYDDFQTGNIITM